MQPQTVKNNYLNLPGQLGEGLRHSIEKAT